MKIVGEIYWYPEAALTNAIDCNTYLINDKITTIVDIGINLEKLYRGMEKDNLDIKKIQLISNTHTHADHCGANHALQSSISAKVTLFKEEVKCLNASRKIAAQFGMSIPEFRIDNQLNDTLSTGEMTFQVIHTPGHSPGAICLYNSKLKTLICGDLIFQNSVGRTDFLGGNPAELKKSIEHLSQLDIEFILPGHMQPIVGRENVVKNFIYIKDNLLSFM